tara:strand:+ start:83 stop:784 length:702 start_codon:yes stop_codon:yes gene_type:complete
MITLDQIAYNIKNLVEGGISGEDSNLSIRQIKHMVHYHRANLLTKYTDSGRYTSDVIFQEQSKTLSSFTQTIPELIGWANNRAIKQIYIQKSSNPIRKYHVGIMSEPDKTFFESSRFAPNKSQFFCTITPGGILRFYENDGQLFADETYNAIITACFANPVSAGASSGGRYPIPMELVSSLIETILSKEFGVYLSVPTDNINDSVDNKGAAASTGPVSAPLNANARSRSARTR